MASQGRGTEVDLLIIGGGINGAGIARDAAGRGLSVTLCDKADLGGATSAASTKLIHGGLRYLEQWQFRLVRESLRERARLLAIAPHIVWPLRFVLPYDRSQRPSWMIRLGLWLYDHLAERGPIPPSSAVDLGADPAGEPLRTPYDKGFAYWDCWAQDNRLVILNAMDAAVRGAVIRPHTEVTGAVRHDRCWHVQLAGGETVTARALVNAAGPWAAQVLDRVADARPPGPLSLVKGSHIVVPRLFAHESAYLLQNRDGRVVFAIPYEEEFTLIGTTDVDFMGDPGAAAITDDESSYLAEAATHFFERPVRPESVCWSYAGVRPLFGSDDDPSDISRGYRLALDAEGGAPLLNVFGGKLTTYRRLAEEVMAKLCTALGMEDRPWSDREPLPGGNFDAANRAGAIAELAARYPWLPAGAAERYFRHYGTRTDAILGGVRSVDALGRDFGAGIYEAELAYAVDQEWVRCGEDFLWRRTKAGLHLDASSRQAVSAWIDEKVRAGAKTDAC